VVELVVLVFVDVCDEYCCYGYECYVEYVD